MLQNKGRLWKSNDTLNFHRIHHYNGKYHKYYDTLNRIENINKTLVWGTTNDGKVILEVLVKGKDDQLWKKREQTADGYFTLENYKKSSWFVTAASSTSLELRGKVHIF